MKKAMLLAVCLILAGLLAVNGTFAAEFTQAISEAVSTLFKTVDGLFFPDPTTDPSTFKVSLAYPDNSGTDHPMLFPGGTVDRQIAVHNDSDSNAACFRIVFAVQAEVFPHLTLTFNKDDYQWSNWRDINIGGRNYKLMIGTYTAALSADHTSPAALLSVTMSEAVTSEQMAQFDDDFLQIQVLAINADDFKDASGQQMSATEALDKALPISDDFNPFE